LAFWQIGAALSTNVFGGPVTVMLCDDKLATFVVLRGELGVPFVAPHVSNRGPCGC